MTTAAPATRTRRLDRSAVASLLRSEWVKLSSLRSHRVVVVLAGVSAFAVAWAVGTFVTDQALTVAEVFAYPSALTALLASTVGILLFTSEEQHGTLAALLIAHPDRWAVAACKIVAAVVCGFSLGAISMSAGALGGVVAGLESGETTSMAATFAWTLGFNAIAAGLGLGLGMIVRSSAVAITGLLAWWFVIESILMALLPESSSRFLPYVAGFRMMGVASEFESAEALAAALSRPQATLVFGAYAAVVLVAGVLLLYRRDAS